MSDVRSRKGNERETKTTKKTTTTKTVAAKCHLSGTHRNRPSVTPIVFHWPLVRGLVSLMSKINVIPQISHIL